MSEPAVSRPRFVRAAVAVCLVVVASRLAAADLCVRFDFEEPPSWINEAVWLPEQDRLLISDWRKNQIVTFAADGAVVETTRFGDGRPPYAVLPFGTDYLFVNGAARVDWVDHGLARARPVSLNLAEGRSTGWSVERIWSKQTAIAGQTLVAMGVLLNEERHFVGAFSVRLPWLHEPFGETEPRPILEFVPPSGLEAGAALSSVPESRRFDPGRVPFYAQSMKYVATIGSRAYILVLIDRPVVVAYDTATHDATVLEGFPWSVSEELPERAAGTPAAHYAHLASLDFPAGLFASNGALFALRRTPRGIGEGTAWRLTKLATDGLVLRNEGTVILPTSSEHVSILPTAAEGWFVIEEGSVVDGPSPFDPARLVGYKHVGTVIVVRNDALETPGRSPLAEGRFDPRRTYCLSR